MKIPHIYAQLWSGGDQEDRKLRVHVEDDDYGGNHNNYEGDVMITRLMCMKAICQARPA